MLAILSTVTLITIAQLVFLTKIVLQQMEGVPSVLSISQIVIGVAVVQTVPHVNLNTEKTVLAVRDAEIQDVILAIPIGNNVQLVLQEL